MPVIYIHKLKLLIILSVFHLVFDLIAMKRIKLGFLVNPIAGMGGRVGLKGTDGDTYKEALKLGAQPISPARARLFLSKIKREGLGSSFNWYAPSGSMGGDYLDEYSIAYNKVYDAPMETTAEDTKKTVLKFLEHDIDVVVFVGGDGTARDICDVINLKVPVLGIPSGVKMYSSVFALNIDSAIEVLRAVINDQVTYDEREVIDIDEEAYRRNTLDIKLYCYLRVPVYAGYIQSSKGVTILSDDIKSNLDGIARYVVNEMIKPDTLYLLGPGTTTMAIAKKLGIEKTLLGVDAVYNGKLVGKDLNEDGIIRLISKYGRVKVILSPIGNQGFILGRGNQQISPNVLRLISKEDLIIISTRSKIENLKSLYVDTGDENIDKKFRGYVKVIVDYGIFKVMKVK